MARTIVETPELHRVGLEGILEQYSEGLTAIYDDIAPFKVTSNQSYIQYMQEGDFGTAPVVTELMPINDDDFFEGYKFNVAPVKRGLGFMMSTEADETDQYGRLSRIVPKIKLAFNQTKEQLAANRINNATSTSFPYTNPDGAALASASHLADGANQSNYMTTAFGPSGLESMIQDLILTDSHRGLPDPQMGPYDLMIHPQQNFLAERVLFSYGQQGEISNDVNRVGRRIRKLISSPYFTNTTFFALRDANASRQPFGHLTARGIKVRFKEDIDIDALKYRVTERYAFFERGWRGFYYSSGGG